MCALHLDRPEHLNIHYVFLEKEPKVKNQRAVGYKYRAKEKIPLDVIDKMTEWLNAYTIDDDLANKRKKVEQINEFLKRYGFTKVQLIEAGYNALIE